MFDKMSKMGKMIVALLQSPVGVLQETEYYAQKP